MQSFVVRAAVLGLAAFSTAAIAAPTNLSAWTAQSTSLPGGQGPANWVVAGNQNSVLQTNNSDPAVFYSDFTAFGQSLRGTISVANGTGDDDFIGFVVGYDPGELTAANPSYLLIDWKQGNQNYAGCDADRGLAVSSVTGPLTLANAWCHNGNGVTELARGNTLSDTGWVAGTTYDFELTYTATRLTVSVNGVLQLDVAGAFGNGRFGFYNYSQQSVTYAGITNDPIPTGVPEPATWAMLMLGFGAMGGMLRKRRGQLATA